MRFFHLKHVTVKETLESLQCKQHYVMLPIKSYMAINTVYIMPAIQVTK